MKMHTQKSRINFQKEKFADYKGRENVFWAETMTDNYVGNFYTAF